MKMNHRKHSWVRKAATTISVTLLVWNSMVCAAFACGVNWSLPREHFDGVDKNGCVSWWRKIGEIDFGERDVFPLHLRFSSQSQISSAYLGRGWGVPLLESSVVLLGENVTEMTDPSGYVRQFLRDSQESSVFHGQGGWKAQMEGNTFTAWAACGWKLVFVNGQIESMTTASNRRLDFVRRGGLTEIREKGVAKFTAARGSSECTFSFGKERIKCGMGEIPGIGFEMLSFTQADGSSEDFQYAIDAGGVCTLKSTSGRQYSWEPISGKIVSDQNWRYKIDVQTTPFRIGTIERTNAEGGYDYWHVDERKGLDISQRADGTKFIKQLFTRGERRGFVQSVREEKNGVSTLTYEVNYDEGGQLRSLFDHGKATQFRYDEKGTLSAYSHDGTIFFDVAPLIGRKK